MRVFAFLGVALCLSCATPVVNGQGKDERNSVAMVATESTIVTQIEPIPGVASNNYRENKSLVNIKGAALEFEIYFGGSACNDINYSFEAHSDSLHIVQKNGTCYRHGGYYGVKGFIKNLKPGKYTFAAIRLFEENRALSVFQKEVIFP